MKEKVGMKQQAMSRLEDPFYGKATLTTLKKIADAFDVGLLVEFVPFTQLINRASGTSYTEHGYGPETMNVPSFEEEERRGAFDVQESTPLISTPQQDAQLGHPLRNPPEDTTQFGGRTELPIDQPIPQQWTRFPLPIPPSGDMGTPNNPPEMGGD